MATPVPTASASWPPPPPTPAACAAIFLVCLGATGSPWSATLVVLTLCMLLVDVMGAMALWGIQLNAGGGPGGWVG